MKRVIDLAIITVGLFLSAAETMVSATEYEWRPKPTSQPAPHSIPIDPGRGDGKPTIVVRDHRTGNGGSGGVTVTPSGLPRGVWGQANSNWKPAVRDHRPQGKVITTANPVGGQERPVVRDHRETSSEPVIRDHRQPVAGPIVRDHRTPVVSGPVVRDHRQPVTGPVVRDHRTGNTGPVIRDHR